MCGHSARKAEKLWCGVMYYAEKTIRVVRETSRDRTRESTLSHLEDGFIPAHPDLLKDIRSKLESGSYLKEPSILVQDIKRDLALSAHCIRQLPQMLGKPSNKKSPLLELAELDKDKCALLLNSVEQLTRHELHKATALEAKRMRHAILACGTTEVLAQSVRERGTDVDSELAFLCALLSQMGMQLVAWNYPKIFSRAAEQTRKGSTTLEEYIDGVLPQPLKEINLALAQHWQLNADIQAIVAGGRAALDDESERSIVTRLCRYGERFARLDSPDLYQNGAAEWLQGIPELTELVGSDTIKFLPERVQEACEPQLSLLREATGGDSKKKASLVTLPTVRGQQMLSTNDDLRRCPSEVQAALREVYAGITEQGESIAALQKLVSEAIPAAGFARGCVYGIDRTRHGFVPLLWINDKKASYFDPKHYFSAWTLADSLDRDVPLVRTITDEQGEALRFITGTVGHPITRGVLFLELNQLARDELAASASMSFRALRKALTDCLQR